MGVIDSTLKMSCCAGIANQIKFGIIIKKKSANPKISKPNLYFFKTRLPLQTYNFSFYPTTLTNCKFFKSSISVQRLINHLLSNLEIISQYRHFFSYGIGSPFSLCRRPILSQILSYKLSFTYAIFSISTLFSDIFPL